jgi:hypothetical protein
LALVQPHLDSGVPHGRVLSDFCDALLERDPAVLDAARDALVRALGPAAVSGAAAVAANFSKNDRLANGLGIPIDDLMFKTTVDLREQLGLNDYRSAANTFRHRPRG